MNNLVNQVQLIGHLGAQPEIKKFDNGNALAKFSLATNEKYTDNNGKLVTNTTWHNVVAWGKMAEIAEQLLTKGQKIVLTGKLVQRNWEDPEGKRRFATEIQMLEMHLAPRRSEENAA